LQTHPNANIINSTDTTLQTNSFAAKPNQQYRY